MHKQHKMVALAMVFALFSIEFVASLNVNSIDASVTKGTTLCLKCQYSLDTNERLSAVQWYRNNRPFYYYTDGADNRNDPLDLHYSSNGFEVDTRKSTNKEVYLDHISPSDSGMYACEVSIGQPRFYSGKAQRHVNILRGTKKSH